MDVASSESACRPTVALKEATFLDKDVTKDRK